MEDIYALQRRYSVGGGRRNNLRLDDAAARRIWTAPCPLIWMSIGRLCTGRLRRTQDKSISRRLLHTGLYNGKSDRVCRHDVNVRQHVLPTLPDAERGWVARGLSM